MEDAMAALSLTLKIATFATLISTALGIGIGYGLARYRFRGREFLDAVVSLPMVLPPTVLGYYLIVVLGRNGVIGRFLDEYFGVSLLFTWQGAVVAAVVVTLPLVIRSVRAAFEGVDEDVEAAARTLGATELTVFARISLPLAWRGVMAGAMLAFARAMGEFGATLMVAGNLPGRTQTVSMAVYDAVQSGNDAEANMLVVIASALCVIILYTAGRLFRAGSGDLRSQA